MNREIWLWLLLVMLADNPKTLDIVEKYGNVRAAAEAIRDGKCDMLNETELARAKAIRSHEVYEVISQCESNNIRIITIEDSEYPSILKEIYSPPIVLFVQGSLEGFDEAPSLAVVGTRHASSYATSVTRIICDELVKVGMTLVSGLAIGVDSAAHKSAVIHGGKTIGVLACGNLVDYPVASHELKQQIISRGGAIISELPPKTGVSSDYFKHRNRIISGLAQGTFLVEVPNISGCHLTAEHAIQQGRELFCLPPYNVFSDSCSGVIRYLRDGAIPVFGYEDIIREYQFSLFKKEDLTE